LIFRPVHADVAIALSQSIVAVVDPADGRYLLPLSADRRAARVPETRDRGVAVDNRDPWRRRRIVAERHVTHRRRTSGFVAVSVSVRRPALLVLVAVLAVKVDEGGDEQRRQ